MNVILTNLVRSANRLTPHGVKLSDFISRDSYRGMLRLWLFDAGSVCFLLTSLFGFSIAVLSLYNDKTSSIYLSNLSYNKYQKKEFKDIVTFSPFYFKNPNITLTKKKSL